jgi:hypothetical protein
VAAGATSDTGITISEGALLQLDAGFTAGLTDLVKVLVEAKMLAAYADGKFEVADAVLLNYGVRFHGKSLAADLGFLRPFVKGQDNDGPFVLGLPFVSFSYRF